MEEKKKKHIERIMHAMFGYEQLRSGQEATLRDVLGGHDTLAVMPTGSGKSMIYQVAGSLLSGPTVIVSPLMALQKDQIEAIETQDIANAETVRETFEKLQEGKLEFLFLAPEQFHNEEILQQLKAAKPSLFVVDEAHCISKWGHDFRPDYLLLGAVIEELGHPRVLALTATASQPVREEIIDYLHKELSARTGYSEAKGRQILTNVSELDLANILATGEVIFHKQLTHLKKIAEKVVAIQEDHRQFDRSRIEMMRGYAEVQDCRREYLLNYFGESFEGKYFFCDNCDAGIATQQRESYKPFFHR